VPGKKYASIKNPKAYEKLRAKGLSKAEAARYSNSDAAKSKGKGKGKGRRK
jgi:hypothetical protein